MEIVERYILNSMLNLSIIIITKDRVGLLEKCLTSLEGQVRKNDEVVVIMDAKTKDGTQELLLKYKKIFPLVYYKSSVEGYPYNYNLGIKKSKNSILVFIGDDCVVTCDFVKRVKIAHSGDKPVVVQGVTYSVPAGNIYAELMGDNYQNWLILNTADLTKHRLKTFDNKNVSIPRKIFDLYGTYDSKFSRGAEDRAFGLKLFQTGLPIVLDASIIAYHNEKTALREFMRQHVRIAQSETIADAALPKKHQIGVASLKKVTLHFQSFVKRELKYIFDFRLIDCIQLPFLYMILAYIRVRAYMSKSS